MGVLAAIIKFLAIAGIIALFVIMPWRISVALLISGGFTLWVAKQFLNRAYYDE